MEQSELLDSNQIVLIWVTRGIEDFFLSFRMSEKVGHSRYDPFINAMGFEMVCKGYLLATKRPEYDGLGDKQVREKVNKLAKSRGHNIAVLVEEVSANIGQNRAQSLLDKKYSGFTGSVLLEAIRAAYFECRYPLAPNPFYKNFPIASLIGLYEDPVHSSGLHQFCYEFCRLILSDLKSKFGIGIPKSCLDEKISGDEGRRFGNLFFDSRIQDYISDN